jgi:hypothetical protein
MVVRVNGTSLPAQTVNTAAYANYTFSATVTGNDVVEVIYPNDQGMRDLVVDYVIVGGVTVQAEGGAMVYDRAISGTAFDGRDVIAGQEGLFWNGALRFARGSGADSWWLQRKRQPDQPGGGRCGVSPELRRGQPCGGGQAGSDGGGQPRLRRGQ